MIDPLTLFSGKKITVMGLGLLGRGLGDTLFLVRCGAHVTVTDLKSAEQLAPSLKQLKDLPIRLKLGGHDPADFTNADMILRNADVPSSSEFLKIAQKAGVPVEMDESLFCRYFSGRVVGVTGTRGKTTTTILIHRILSASNRNVLLGGNLMGHATLPLLETVGPEDTVVMELSSWQLQGFHAAKISPHASVFTNVYPDHLNRYTGMDDYIQDKKAVFLYQSGSEFCVFNGHQSESTALAGEAPAKKSFFHVADVPSEWSLRLPGIHNRENVAAALCLTRTLGISDEVIRSAVESFDGVEHRLQRVGEKNGIVFINDATSTTPVAGCAALNALNALNAKRILLLAGGADKKLDLTPFAEAAAAKAERIALLEGTATDGLERGITKAGGSGKIVGRFSDLREAVYCLLRNALTGDIVLLSPGCASFGMFRNEFHRGETFVQIVRELMETDQTDPE